MIHAFTTSIYQAPLMKAAAPLRQLNRQLSLEVRDLLGLDQAGQHWSKKNYPNGFTSYASANRMHEASPTFAKLESLIRPHVIRYVKALHLDLRPAELQMSTLWVNVMPSGAQHPLHHHPLSVISGTYYLEIPRGASALEFEDPRYAHFMARPLLRSRAPRALQSNLSVAAKVGQVVLFESWLRHRVPTNLTKQPRVSLSFNYDWR